MTTLSIRDQSVAVLLAVALTGGLWMAWSWLELPAGQFVAGLTGHGPDPFLWRRFLVVWPPLAQLSFAAGYWVLMRRSSDASLRRHFLLDQGLVVLVVPLLLALRAAGPGGQWRVVLTVGYGLFVACKTAVFLHALWRWLASRSTLGNEAVTAVTLGSLLPYVLLCGSVATAISSVGDEPYYLLTAHSLIQDLDADLTNNLERRDYLPFYWDRLASAQQPTFLRPIEDSLRQYSGLQPLLLVPGYGLGGRAGALVTMAILSAAALALAFWLALETGAGLRAAYLAWVGAAFSAPVVSLSTSSFVEMSAGFFLALAASGVLGMRQSWSRGVLVTGCLVALVTLKNRLLVMAVPVLLSLTPRITRRHLAVLGLSLSAVAVAAIYYDARVMGGVMSVYLLSGGPLGIEGWAPETLLGYLFDQEYGLLLSAPVFALGLMGAVVVLRERRYRLLLLTFGPFVATWLLFGLGVGVSYGGTAPPGRYLAASLPLLATLSAHAYARVRGGALWSLVGSLLAASLLYAVTVSVWPAWRYQHGVGRNAVLMRLWDWAGLDLGRLLPSFLPPRLEWTVAGAAALLALGVGGWWLAARPGQVPPRGTAAFGALALVVVMSGGVASVAWHPWGTFPAGGWQGRGGMVFRGSIPIVNAKGDGATPHAKAVWAAQRSAAVAVAPWLPAGRYRLVIRAGAMGPAGGPKLTVRVGDAVLQEVRLASAPPPAWRSADYASEVAWSGGRLAVHLELEDISPRDPIRLAYVEHLQLEPLTP